jgi:hypothetical protein
MRVSNLIVERENRNSKLKQSEAAKWELIRRLRYGALLRLFGHRWGHVLPDDDAGRDDLWLLVTNVSLAAAEPQKKMRHVIEMWAPWMPAEEREAYVKHVWGLDIYERNQTGLEIGKRLGLTNAEREALKLWPFFPIDKTEEEIAEQAKVRERERRAHKRRKKGVRTREAYLAELASRPKPWVAEGISRRTWERRRKACPNMTQSVSGDQRSVSQGESEIIVFKQRTDVASPNMRSLRKEGLHGDECEILTVKPPKNGEMETNASSSPELRTDLATNEDPRIAAIGNWGAADKKQVSAEFRERYSKIRARFDALPHPRLGAAA